MTIFVIYWNTNVHGFVWKRSFFQTGRIRRKNKTNKIYGGDIAKSEKEVFFSSRGVNGENDCCLEYYVESLYYFYQICRTYIISKRLGFVCFNAFHDIGGDGL